MFSHYKVIYLVSRLLFVSMRDDCCYGYYLLHIRPLAHLRSNHCLCFLFFSFLFVLFISFDSFDAYEMRPATFMIVLVDYFLEVALFHSIDIQGMFMPALECAHSPNAQHFNHFVRLMCFISCAHFILNFLLSVSCRYDVVTHIHQN